MALTIKLTPDQAQKVRAGAKQEAPGGPGRPKYWDPDAKVEQEITADMEAVVLLTPAQQRQQAVQYMRGDQKAATDSASQRDACLLAALSVDAEVANQQIGDLAGQSRQLAQIQQVVKNPAFQEVADVGPFVRAMQLGTDEQVHALDQAKHRLVAAAVQTARVLAGGVTADQKKSVESWAQVLSAYTGS
jgi:hypothetical protein